MSNAHSRRFLPLSTIQDFDDEEGESVLDPDLSRLRLNVQYGI